MTEFYQALEMHDAIMRVLLKIWKGYEVKTEGDAFFVAFSNAFDAIRWCIAVQVSKENNV